MKFFNFSKYFAAEKEMASDPVCGMRVLRNEDLKASFKGKTYYFCSANCLEEFRKAPSEFATEG